MFKDFMCKFVAWLDPHLDRFRAKTPPAKTPPYTPETMQDFVALLKRTPRHVLSNRDRSRIAAIMSFEDRRVRDLMITKSKMIFVQNDEILGPLMLDRLYKSGFTSFPVVDSNQKVLGILHTKSLNTLEIKNTNRADKYLDSSVHYLHARDPLSFAVEEIERLNANSFLVLDGQDKTVGYFTTEMLLEYLLGQ